MNRIFKILCGLILVASFSSCDMFKLDNMDGPNAKVYGKLIDKATGKTLQVEYYYANNVDYYTVVVQEQGWDALADQRWKVKFDGNYRNNRVFAGDYIVDFKNLPCYQLPDSERAFTLKKGENQLDFEVVPFCRITDLKLGKTTDGKLEAKFKVQAGDPSKHGEATTIQKIQFSLNTTSFVGGNTMNMVNTDPGASSTTDIDFDTEYTLLIDPLFSGNAEAFRYTRDLYVRVGAMLSNDINTQNLYNFSPIYKVSKDFSTFTEINFD